MRFLTVFAMLTVSSLNVSSSDAETQKLTKFATIKAPAHDSEFDENFAIIKGQLTRKETQLVGLLSKSADSLVDAYKSLPADERFKAIHTGIEHDGWFLFTTQTIDNSLTESETNTHWLPLFLEGFGIKKGTTEIYYFGRW